MPHVFTRILEVRKGLTLRVAIPTLKIMLTAADHSINTWQ